MALDNIKKEKRKRKLYELDDKVYHHANYKHMKLTLKRSITQLDYEKQEKITKGLMYEWIQNKDVAKVVAALTLVDPEFKNPPDNPVKDKMESVLLYINYLLKKNIEDSPSNRNRFAKSQNLCSRRFFLWVDYYGSSVAEENNLKCIVKVLRTRAPPTTLTSVTKANIPQHLHDMATYSAIDFDAQEDSEEMHTPETSIGSSQVISPAIEPLDISNTRFTQVFSSHALNQPPSMHNPNKPTMPYGLDIQGHVGQPLGGATPRIDLPESSQGILLILLADAALAGVGGAALADVGAVAAAASTAWNQDASLGVEHKGNLTELDMHDAAFFNI